MKKICVITGTRADYGLLFWLMKEIEKHPRLKLQVIVTGMHLSPEFGLTYKEVQKDFNIDRKLEILLSSDTPIGISKSMGLAQISFAEAYDELNPDLIIILGDRFEAFSAASAAMIARIPIAHLHGGESTEGLIDESIRHSITKMSHLHFVATNIFRNRVIQLGESPDRVFDFGAIGIDNINKLKLLSKSELEKSLSVKLKNINFLITFHPVTLEKNTARSQFKELLLALSGYQNILLIFTKANSDTDGRIINKLIDEYVTNHPQTAISFTSLGQLRYLSAVKYVDAVIGNSSSGLIEAPSFKTPTINIGDRQKGRVKAPSVIDCLPLTSNIKQAIDLALSNDFKQSLKDMKNPYGKGGTSSLIAQKIDELNFDNLIMKKFHNISEGES